MELQPMFNADENDPIWRRYAELQQQFNREHTQLVQILSRQDDRLTDTTRETARTIIDPVMGELVYMQAQVFELLQTKQYAKAADLVDSMKERSVNLRNRLRELIAHLDN